MIKSILFILVIPFIILLSNDFELDGFIVAGCYLILYNYFSNDKDSDSYTPKELERKRKSGYDAWLEKSRKEKLRTPVKVKKYFSPVINATTKTPTKFTMSQNEFETEINSQLNNIKGSLTKILWVGDKHRTHPWSLRPGGCTVVVLFKNKACLGYDKVKRPDRYTRKISQDYISNHYSNSHSSSLEDYINEIYLTSDSGVDLKKVWHSNMSTNPWQVLEKYRTM
jgi:hypothetical protein